MKLFACLALVSLSLPACVSAPKRAPAQIADGPPLTQARIEDYGDKMAALLSANVFTLDRPLLTFHYDSAPANAAPIASLEAIETHRRSVDPVKGVNFYLALNPLVSADYGRMALGGPRSAGSPRLYVVLIKSGTRILNDAPIPDAGHSAKLISALDLDARKAFTDRISALQYIYQMPTDAASKAKIQERLRAKLGVTAELYSFREGALPRCRIGEDDRAIIMHDLRSFTYVATYSDQDIYESVPLAAKVERLFNQVTIRFLAQKDNPLPRALSLTAQAAPVATDDFERWKDRFIGACGAPWPFEK